MTPDEIATKLQHKLDNAKGKPLSVSWELAREAIRHLSTISKMEDIVSAFEALLPKHAASLTICHNDHKGVYETVAQTVEDDERDPKTSRYTWRNDAEKQEAIDTNEMWYCQWYPDTPVGFCCVAAPTLAKLVAFLAEA